MLVSFDPGRTTGFCAAKNILYPVRSFDIAQSTEIAWEDRFSIRYVFAKIRKLEDEGKRKLHRIIVEDFRLNPNLAAEQSYSDFPSCQVIGIIEAYADLYGYLPLIIKQPPSNRKSVQILPEHTDKLLAGSEHARDAYRHLRYFVVMHKYGPKSKPEGA